jgi:hypothetical protein
METEKLQTGKIPETLELKPAVLTETDNSIPPQYANLPSEVAEEMWTEPTYVDEEQNRAVQEWRQAGLARIRENEREREEKKRKMADDQYAQLPNEFKTLFPSLQQQSSELVAQHIKGIKKIENLSREELFVLGKARAMFEDSQRKNPDALLTMVFGKEIDQKIYTNLLNKLAFEGIKNKKVESEKQKLKALRKSLGLPKEIDPVSVAPRELNPEIQNGPEVTPDLAELKRIFDNMIARATRQNLRDSLKTLYEELQKERDRSKIAQVILDELTREKRRANYPANAESIQAWEYATQNQDAVGYINENDWHYRGIFPSKSENTRTETRGSLNINVTPDVIRELDSLIKNGIFKGNYKFGDPQTGASPLQRHDAITLYFLEPPSEEALEALSAIARKNFRGNNLLGKEISDGFYMSEIGSVSNTHAREFITRIKDVDEKLGIAIENFLTHSDKKTGNKRVAMSEAQYYATKETLSLYGYNISYNKERGITVSS